MKKKKFIQKSTYPGGNAALKEFIKLNLKYPKEAIESGVQGDVLLKFKVNPTGKTNEIKLIKGIGYGCDTEAIRLVGQLKYTKSNNRKIRVTTHKQITIKFRLPTKKAKTIIKYTIVK